MRGGCFGQRSSIGADFEAVTTVRGLQVVHLATSQPKDPLHRGRHVLVETVWKLDHDDGTLSWCPQETAHDGSPGLTPHLAQYDLHTEEASTGLSAEKAGSSASTGFGTRPVCVCDDRDRDVPARACAAQLLPGLKSSWPRRSTSPRKMDCKFSKSPGLGRQVDSSM
jgi:hypothetical protein